MRYLWLLVLLSLPSPGVSEPLRVFVSVLPQKTFVEKVGHEHVDVHVMVQPGFSPQTYDPSPQQIAALAEAALYIRTGVPFEHAWMARIRSASPNMQVLDAREGIDLRVIEAHHHDDEPETHWTEAEHATGNAAPSTLGASPQGQQHEQDPHVWTSPPLVKAMARKIRDKLSELDPEHAGDYADNYAAFAAELDALDRYIRERLGGLQRRRFMVFHPAWGYFADTYDLIQVPIERLGKSPGPRALTELIDRARREGIKVIFVQPQFDRRAAKQVARAIDGAVVPLDPLAADYEHNLRRVAAALAEAGGS
jgi:zinc transport system substrate-binding protein